MVKPFGPLPKLARADVRRLLDWHARRQKFSDEYGTTRHLAERLGVGTYAVRRALCFIDFDPPTATARIRIPPRGRRSSLSESQFAIVERWATARREFRAGDLSPKQMADELGIGVTTLFGYIRRPERAFEDLRPAKALVGANRSREEIRRPTKLRGRANRRDSDNALRNVLLRSWRSRRSASG